MTARRRPCSYVATPHSLTYARLYPCGMRCDRHAPWALAGRPEPKPGPGWPARAWTTPTPLGASALIDARAIASGKRRSNPEAYRAAQAAVGQLPAEPQVDLRVDLGEWDAKAWRWLRYPAADFTCPRCGFTASASGDAVARFAKTIRGDHAAGCPPTTRREPPA